MKPQICQLMPKLKFFILSFKANLQKARYAVENLKTESEISKYIKKHFDKKYGPNWHCIVGKYICDLPNSLGK